MIDENLSACVVAYVGSVGRLSEVQPEDRVVDLVGEGALYVLPTIRRILDEVYDEPGRFFIGRRPGWDGVGDLGDAVAEHLVASHPELSRDAVQAIANRFAYDYK